MARPCFPLLWQSRIMLDPLVRTYVQLKSAEERLAGTPEEIAEAHLIRAIEMLGAQFGEKVRFYGEMLYGGRDFLSEQITGTARRIMALKDTGKTQ